MASVSGSRLAFFGNGNATGSNVNIVLTPDGTGTLATVAGAFNIEVFTTSVANPSIAPGFDASAFVQGAVATGVNNVIQAGTPTSIEQVLDGSYTLLDQGGAGGENISIVGSAATVTVIGGRGDTISGSANTAANQLIDASGGGGLQNVTGGAGNTTVFGGDFDTITGAAGALTVIGGGHNHMIVNAGAGGLAAQQFGTKNFVAGGGGITFIDDGFAGAGQNTLVGGSGGSNFIQGNVGDSIVGGSGPVTILNSFTFGGQTVVGSTTGLSTIVEGGSGDSIVAGGGLFAFISAVDGSHIQGGTNPLGATDVFALGKSDSVAGGAGALIVGAAGVTNSSITGGSGNLQVFALGTGNTVVGSTAGTTSINDVAGGWGGVVGGAGATTIIAGANDSVVGGTGNMEVRIRSDITGTETVNLSAGTDIVRDTNVGGAGASASVTGFNTGTDSIASADSSGTLIANSTTDGAGNVILNFTDSSTMTLIGVTNVNTITFIS